jgi:hypothetical protein
MVGHSEVGTLTPTQATQIGPPSTGSEHVNVPAAFVGAFQSLSCDPFVIRYWLCIPKPIKFQREQ